MRSRDLITWRGSRLTPAQAAVLQKGYIFRACMFVATSLRREVAEPFVNPADVNQGYLLKFHIPKGCRNGCTIYHLARIEEEREVLIPPYTPFRVIDVAPEQPSQLYNQVTIITLETVDGMIYENLVERGGAPEDSAHEFMGFDTPLLRGTYRRDAPCQPL